MFLHDRRGMPRLYTMNYSFSTCKNPNSKGLFPSKYFDHDLEFFLFGINLFDLTVEAREWSEINFDGFSYDEIYFNSSVVPVIICLAQHRLTSIARTAQVHFPPGSRLQNLYFLING